jgi:hypothetical protein
MFSDGMSKNILGPSTRSPAAPLGLFLVGSVGPFAAQEHSVLAPAGPNSGSILPLKSSSRLTPGESSSYSSGAFAFFSGRGELPMYRPSAEEFLQTLLEALDDLPADFARRFEEVLKREDVDRAQAIRQLFEDFAGE